MSDPYLGEIRMFSGNFAPEDWLFCDGKILRISEFESLFSVIRTFYGGDGVSTFAVPDLRGRIPLHQDTGSATYKLGTIGGVEQVQLLESQLPRHTHPAKVLSTLGTTTSPSNAFWARSTISQYSTNAPNSVMGSQTISAVGGIEAHDNMMPFLPISFIIATNGIYPSPN